MTYANFVLSIFVRPFWYWNNLWLLSKGFQKAVQTKLVGRTTCWPHWRQSKSCVAVNWLTKRNYLIKVLISCLGILHICNLWILLRKIVIYLVGRKFVIYLVGRKCYLRRFFAVKIKGSDVNPGICVIVKARSYRHTENISLDSEPNRYYLMKINRNSQIHGSFVH